MITVTGLLVMLAFSAVWAIVFAMLGAAGPRLDAALRGQKFAPQASASGPAWAAPSRAFIRA